MKKLQINLKQSGAALLAGLLLLSSCQKKQTEAPTPHESPEEAVLQVSLRSEPTVNTLPIEDVLYDFCFTSTTNELLGFWKRGAGFKGLNTTGSGWAVNFNSSIEAFGTDGKPVRVRIAPFTTENVTFYAFGNIAQLGLPATPPHIYPIGPSYNPETAPGELMVPTEKLWVENPVLPMVGKYQYISFVNASGIQPAYLVQRLTNDADATATRFDRVLLEHSCAKLDLYIGVAKMGNETTTSERVARITFGYYPNEFPYFGYKVNPTENYNTGSRSFLVPRETGHFTDKDDEPNKYAKYFDANGYIPTLVANNEGIPDIQPLKDEGPSFTFYLPTNMHFPAGKVSPYPMTIVLEKNDATGGFVSLQAAPITLGSTLLSAQQTYPEYYGDPTGVALEGMDPFLDGEGKPSRRILPNVHYRLYIIIYPDNKVMTLVQPAVWGKAPTQSFIYTDNVTKRPKGENDWELIN